MKSKVPRRIWHGISANGKLTHLYLLTKKEVDYYAKKNGMEFVEYVLAGEERKAVARGLEKYLKVKLQYFNEVINDPSFVHDESGHWDTGSRNAYRKVLEELKRIGGGG